MTYDLLCPSLILKTGFLIHPFSKKRYKTPFIVGFLESCILEVIEASAAGANPCNIWLKTKTNILPFNLTMSHVPMTMAITLVGLS